MFKIVKRKAKLLIVALLFLIATVPGVNIKAEMATEKNNDFIKPVWYNAETGLDIYGNNGTVFSPYEIRSEQDLLALSYYSNTPQSIGGSDFSGKNIIFTQRNLDLIHYNWHPIGESFDFYGNIIGNDAYIENISIGCAEQDISYEKIGFFATSYGVVENLNLHNIHYRMGSNTFYTGGFVAKAGGKLIGCTVEGLLELESAPLKVAGGFAGDAQDVECMEKCSTDVTIMVEDISTGAYLGGFAGIAGQRIEYCKSQNYIHATKTKLKSVGGFLGDGCSTVCISHCKTSSDVWFDIGNDVEFFGGFAGSDVLYVDYCNCNGTLKSYKNDICLVGGFIGYDIADSVISHSSVNHYMECELTKTKSQGGFTAYTQNGRYSNCDVTGTIHADNCFYAGGFVGSLEESRFSQCESSCDLVISGYENGAYYVGGFAGLSHDGNFYKCCSFKQVVTGNMSRVGGFCGLAKDGQANSCYTRSDIKTGTSAYVGGFDGMYEGQEIIASYCTGKLEVTGRTTFGGAIGSFTGPDRISSLYWNKEKPQIWGNIPVENPVPCGTGEYLPNITGLTTNIMTNPVFAELLNLSGGYTNWQSNANINNGYPYF